MTNTGGFSLLRTPVHSSGPGLATPTTNGAPAEDATRPVCHDVIHNERESLRVPCDQHEGSNPRPHSTPSIAEATGTERSRGSDALPGSAQQGAGAPPAPEGAWLQPSAIARKSRAENFPVASLLAPASLRSHLAALYCFARLVDDLGDELPTDRLAALEWLEHEVHLLYEATPTHPCMLQLVPTVRALRLPRAPFLRLIAANRQDQVVTQYERFEDLLSYCTLSANPVGRLVLHVVGKATPERLAWSDAVCTGLQIIDHCQDVGTDARRGRVYLPQNDLLRYGCTSADLTAPVATPSLRRVIEIQCARAAALLDSGAPLVGTLQGRTRLVVAAFIAGGHGALGALARRRYDPLQEGSARRHLALRTLSLAARGA